MDRGSHKIVRDVFANCFLPLPTDTLGNKKSFWKFCLPLMQTLYPRDSEDSAPDGDDDVLSKELKDNFNAVRTLKQKDEQAAREMALKTALAADDAISRLHNGIAELEALLAQELQQQEQDNAGGMVFPSLPPIVVEEEEEPESKKGKLVRSS